MQSRLRLVGIAFGMSFSILAGGCKSAPAPAPAAQSASQGAPAPASTVTAPPPAAVPTVPAEGAATSAPVAAAPSTPAMTEPPVAERAVAPVERRVLTAPAGSRVAVTLTETLKASTANVGDGFTGVLAEPLAARGGGVVFPRGTRVAGTVVAAKGRGRFKGAGAIGIQLTSIGGVRVTSSEYEKEEKGKGKRTGALIGGGGGLGAIIGGIAGGGKGALIGGLAGAGAGTAGAAYTGNHDVVIPSESLISFRLENSVSR